MNILYATVLGALAGLVSWLILSLPFIEQASPILKIILRGLLLGLIFGSFLGMARGMGDKSYKRPVSSLLDGIVLGVAGGLASQSLIIGLGSNSDKSLVISMVGWVVFGLFLGAGQRLDKPSVKGIVYGIIGGVVGGDLGGIVLDYVSKGSLNAAWWGQAVGMIALGAALGAGISAVLIPLDKEAKKIAPSKPSAAPVIARGQEVKVEPARPAPGKPAPMPAPAQRPEIKAEPARPAPVQPSPAPAVAQKPEIKVEPVRPAPVQQLKKWLEANFLIERPQITIGSSPDNDIIIRAPGVEAKQALVYQEKGRYLIRNTGTSREIFVSFTGDLIQGRNIKINEFNALKEGSAVRVDKESLMFFHSSPPSLSVRYPIDKARIIIGTSPQNDIVIRDASASSRHAQISWENERGMVVDMGSSSGTYVSYSGDKTQERKVQEKNAITNNSSIRIGNVTFRVLG